MCTSALEDLRIYGFSEEVVEAVGLLTNDKEGMTYDDYIAKVAFSGNELAIRNHKERHATGLDRL